MKKSSRRSRFSRCGVTLIEAVLGTAILGSLLVTILIGAGGLQAQMARADRRVDACRAADALLEQWWAKPEEFPRAASGKVQGRDGLSWRTRAVENPDARALKAEAVALEVFAPGQPGEKPLVSVEVLLPEKPEREDAEGKGPDAR
jgi:hypothetical protein